MISAILLAAGRSRRMNGKNKLTEKIKNVPLIKHSVKNILLSSVEELIVVLGYQNEIIEKIIDKHEKVKFVFNKEFDSGMSSSIKVGLNHLSESTEASFHDGTVVQEVNKTAIKNVVTIYLDNSIIQLNPQLVLGKAFNTILNLIYSSKCFFF